MTTDNPHHPEPSIDLTIDSPELPDQPMNHLTAGQLSGQRGQMAGHHDRTFGHSGQMTGQDGQISGHNEAPSGQESRDRCTDRPSPTQVPPATGAGADRLATPTGDPGAVFASLAASTNLRQRRLEMLALQGPDAVFTEPQGREPGEATAPENLADLIFSISVVGLVQPFLVEELPNDPAAPNTSSEVHDHPATRRLRLVSGKRRLRAMRWGATHDPDNPQFTAIPAVVCPGPLSDAERRCWQLVENIAREDLQPGELAAALLLERCAIIEQKLRAAGRTIPPGIDTAEDPVVRWHGLERLRGTTTTLAAPWDEVLHRLGLQLSERRARQLVRAFAALPRQISADMDTAKVRLHTRITFARLRTGRQQVADEIWSAIRDQQRTDLLAAAIHAGLETPHVSSQQALWTAERVHDQANLARAEKLTKPHDTSPPAELAETGTDRPSQDRSTAEPRLLSTVLDDARTLTRTLRIGRGLPSTYGTGSLRLQLTELLAVLDRLDSNQPVQSDPGHSETA